MTATNCRARFSVTKDLHPGYRLGRQRGSGGFGQVWEAEHATGKAVALKFLPSASGPDTAQELRSIQTIQELTHPHLTRIDRVWCAGGFLVVAMELADGSLADLMEVYRSELGGGLPAGHLLPLLAQAAEALDFLNSRQHQIKGQWVTIQHRDVTPANLLVFGETVKLSDFGLATTLIGKQKAHPRAGTPAYAAPEVFQGYVTNRTDQYSLAICYCWLRSGRLPFSNTPADFYTPYARPAPDLSMLEASEQPAIARALAQAPQDRWPCSQALIAELQRRTVAPVSIDAPRPDTRQHPRYEPNQRIGCQVQPTLGNQPWGVVVQNVSLGGARLRIISPQCDLKAGRLLDIILTNGTSGMRVSIQFRLVHGKEVENGDYEVGGGFSRPLTSTELAALAEGCEQGIESTVPKS